MMILIYTTTMMLMIKHPLSLGLNILIHTISTCLIMGMMSMNFWFSYILILIMIGGLLVLFIYMTSIASNEKFNFNKMIMMMSIIPLFYFFNMIPKYINNELMNYNMFILNLNKFITYPNSNIFIIMVFYLLVSMIAVVKISKTNMGPLRKIKYENTFTKKKFFT
uniref:NADH-ubiquinone oxidoreductase chain 6 n=1 Tax=Anisosticta novemdecimpunctata TaxID=185876 RepID=A0A191ZQS5_ANINO|nr:NADH dehydrogenase subunit 6 [Anisosticta novemdecimpunctata]